MFEDVSSPSEVSPAESFVIQIPQNIINQEKGQQKDAKRYNDHFKNSIRSFVTDAETQKNSMFSISQICCKHDFQKRRFYDVLNVLEAIGCCEKINSETIRWLGLSNIPSALLQLQKSLNVDSINTSVDEIFSAGQSIMISQLAKLFILCFLVTQSQALDIKQIAMFLSRNNQRYKTTLCKLYQITHILEAGGILKHATIPSKIILVSKYCVFLNGQKKDTQIDSNPLSIQNLLNDHSVDFIREVEKRRFLIFVGYSRPDINNYYLRAPVPEIMV